MEALQQLESWYQTPLGHAVFSAEKLKLSQALPHLFGYTLLQVGCVHHHEWLQASSIPHKIYFSLLKEVNEDVSLIGQSTELPFRENSMDVVLLPHVLEFSESPWLLLKEASRVIVPEGVIVLLFFNRLSLWGLNRFLTSSMASFPPLSSTFHVPQLRKLLEELDFETLFFSSFFFRPPINQPVWLKRLFLLETLGQLVWPYPGAIQLLVAKRKVASLTPLQSHRIWQTSELKQEYA